MKVWFTPLAKEPPPAEVLATGGEILNGSLEKEAIDINSRPITEMRTLVVLHIFCLHVVCTPYLEVLTISFFSLLVTTIILQTSCCRLILQFGL